MQSNIPTGLYLYLIFFMREVVMEELLNQKQQNTDLTPCSMRLDFIQKYKVLCSREREIMWMKHRNLRKVFDEIEKTDN